jgi:hypothetical protein
MGRVFAVSWWYVGPLLGTALVGAAACAASAHANRKSGSTAETFAAHSAKEKDPDGPSPDVRMAEAEPGVNAPSAPPTLTVLVITDAAPLAFAVDDAGIAWVDGTSHKLLLAAPDGAKAVVPREVADLSASEGSPALLVADGETLFTALATGQGDKRVARLIGFPHAPASTNAKAPAARAPTPPTGTNAPVRLVTGPKPSPLSALALDAQSVYWIEEGPTPKAPKGAEADKGTAPGAGKAHPILKVGKKRRGNPEVLVPDARTTGPLAVDLSGIYFVTDDGGIGRLPLKGGETLPFVAAGEHGKTDAFALAEFAVYRAVGSKLFRAAKGGDPEVLIATEPSPIKAIAIAPGGTGTGVASGASAATSETVVLALENGTLVRRERGEGAKDEVLARGNAGQASGLCVHGDYAYVGTPEGIARTPLHR